MLAFWNWWQLWQFLLQQSRNIFKWGHSTLCTRPRKESINYCVPCCTSCICILQEWLISTLFLSTKKKNPYFFIELLEAYDCVLKGKIFLVGKCDSHLQLMYLPNLDLHHSPQVRGFKENSILSYIAFHVHQNSWWEKKSRLYKIQKHEATKIQFPWYIRKGLVFFFSHWNISTSN